MGLNHVRTEIEHMRVQLGRQRKQILQLQPPASRLRRPNFCWSGCW